MEIKKISQRCKMSGECDRCSEHAIDCKCNNNLPDRMIKAIIRLGRAQQYLDILLRSEAFKRIKGLDYETQHQISCINDDLWFLMNILRGKDES